MSDRVLKKWLCFTESFGNQNCQDAHWRGQQPTWKGDRPYPLGHDECRWVVVSGKPDKTTLVEPIDR